MQVNSWPDKIPKPNLFIVGEQKSGTTTLHSLLAQHDSVFMSPLKELGHFCKDFHEESDRYHKKKVWYPIRELAQYQRFFRGSSGEKYLGESSSLYLYSKVAAKEIKKFNPDAKIIILLREPSSFLRSLHSQYVKETSEDIHDFEEAYAAEPTRKRGKNLSKQVRNPSLLFYSERVKYADNLSRYFELFPPEQIMVILAEDFKRNPKQTYSKVLEFLSLEMQEGIDLSSKNLSQELAMEGMSRFLNLPLLAYIKGLLVNNLPPFLLMHIYNLMHSRLFRKSAAKQPETDEHDITRIKEALRVEVSKLQKLLEDNHYNIDLASQWGYDLQKSLPQG